MIHLGGTTGCAACVNPCGGRLCAAHAGGATVHDVRLMCETVGPEVSVKAAGGIRTYRDAINMIKAGATRIDASASVNILQEA